ncbi:CZB domain-containing protein, partial [Heliobacterium chlorum]
VENMNTSFHNMDKSFEQNSLAVNVVSRNATSLIQVFENIGRSIQNLAPIAQEQTATFEEIQATINDISFRTSSLNEMMQKSNVSLLELLNSANAVRTEIGKNKIHFSTNEVLDLTKTDHLLWKVRITYMLRGLLELDEKSVSDHNACKLGKWYNSDGQKLFARSESFKQLGLLHSQFHQKC